MASYSWSGSSTSISGDISAFSHLSKLTTVSTGMTMAIEETEEESRGRRKELIISLLEEDQYLLQEIVTELRKDKIEKIKESI